MGKTIRGDKGPSYDYWSRRANGEGKNLQSPGRFSKKTMNRASRHREKQDLKGWDNEELSRTPD